MKTADRILIAVIVALGLALVVLKASTATITTDEAWNFNHWISGGFKTILTDYSAFNNHILQTALSRISMNVMGENEFAQRYPSILAYLLFAFVLIKLIESAITNRAFRILSFAMVILHPYILDFAALARGYMLMISFSTLAIYFMSEALHPKKDKRVLLYLLLASYTAGMAIATVPSTIRLLPALLLILLIRPGARANLELRPVHVAALLCPAILVVAAFYIPAMRSAKNLSIELGTKSMFESLRSLQMLFFYTPSAVLNAGGNPVAGPETLSFWTSDIVMNHCHALLAGKTVFFLLIADFICILALPFKIKLPKTARVAHIALATILSTMLIERYISGSRLPVGRAWLVIVPLLTLTAVPLIERLIAMFDKAHIKPVSTVVAILAFAIIIIRIHSFSVTTYWEWPDNHAAPDIVDGISSVAVPGETLRVSCPTYYHACLTYYADQMKLSGVTFIPFEHARANYHLFREDLLEKPISEGLIIYRYPNTRLAFTRDPSTPIFK